MRLVLDFVPNHVAVDHPWVYQHPEYFIQGTYADLAAQPGAFFEANGRVIAHGRDPYFPAWTDTAQIDAFAPGLRAAAIATLADIARQADGVRCDMAMLLMGRIFGRRGRSARRGTVHRILVGRDRRGEAADPHFIFLAEAYWDMEWELQQQGFDYCYDKRLYDRLVHAEPPAVRDTCAPT